MHLLYLTYRGKSGILRLKEITNERFNMKGSLCAHKRGERYFTSYHWCNECPPMEIYRAMERQQKLDWANRDKKK